MMLSVTRQCQQHPSCNHLKFGRQCDECTKPFLCPPCRNAILSTTIAHHHIIARPTLVGMGSRFIPVSKLEAATPHSFKACTHCPSHDCSSADCWCLIGRSAQFRSPISSPACSQSFTASRSFALCLPTVHVVWALYNDSEAFQVSSSKKKHLLVFREGSSLPPEVLSANRHTPEHHCTFPPVHCVSSSPDLPLRHLLCRTSKNNLKTVMGLKPSFSRDDVRDTHDISHHTSFQHMDIAFRV